MKSSIYTIRNNSNSYDVRFPTQQNIPISNTEESARLKRNDWFFRCYQEYMYVTACGGSSWFITLTFNNENLPHLCLTDYLDCLPYTGTQSCNSYIKDLTSEDCIPCFNQKLVRRFLKVLRTNLTRKGYNTREMQYIICSEFGSKTKRPHHHGQLFFPYADIPEDVLLDSLRSCWHYGFIGRSKRGLKITGIPAIRYATKYVSKDMSFGQTLSFKRLKMSLEQIIAIQDCYPSKVLRHMLQPCCPCNVISHGLGKHYMSELSKMSEDELLRLCAGEKQIMLPFDSNNIQSFRLPRYYVNRLAYVVDHKLSQKYFTTIVLSTDFGIKLKKHNIFKSILRTSSRIKSYNSSVLRQFNVSLDDIKNYENFKNNPCFPLWCCWYRSIKGSTFTDKFHRNFCSVSYNELTDYIVDTIDTVKSNYYVVNDWYNDQLVDICSKFYDCGDSTIGAVIDYLDEMYSNLCPSPLKQCNNLQGDELFRNPECSAIERAYQTFLYVNDCFFWNKEKSKCKNRLEKEEKKYKVETSMFNPLGFINYSSYDTKKDF